MTRRGLFQAIAAAAMGNAIPVGPVAVLPRVPAIPPIGVGLGETSGTGTTSGGAHTHTISGVEGLSLSHTHCCGQGTGTDLYAVLTHTHGGHGR